MIKQRFNTTLIFLLLTAVLMVKWVPTHVHLNVSHDHGSEQVHQHGIETHAHQQLVLHGDQIDTDHMPMDEARVVDLDPEQNPPNDTKQTSSLSVWTTFVYDPPRIQLKEFDFLGSRRALPRLLHQRPQPHAPPQFS